MMEAHTQGDWFQSPHDPRLIVVGRGVNDFDAPIRRMVARIAERPGHEAAMNGRLICAAPALYAAVEAYIDAMCARDHEGQNQALIDMSQALDDARLGRRTA